MRRTAFFLAIVLIFSPIFLQSQNTIRKTITGKVTDSLGNALAGAVVQLKGSRSAAIADANGVYNVQVPNEKAGVLIVSMSGYAPREIGFDNNTRSIDISMRVHNNELDQIVVVGYGKQKKATVTGSVAVVAGSEILQSPAVNISNSLAGRVSGLIINNRTGEPGSDGSSILIRGVGTLGDNTPLFVIDGVANRQGFERMNPEDIESVTILKDASAAIYGAQAANGVILITTKRGKSGKPTITYNGNYGLSQPTRVPQLVNAYQYAIYRNEKDIRYGLPATFTQSQIDKYKNGSDPISYPSTDWYDAVLKPWTPQTQHSITLSGGSDRIKYYLSGQYVYEDAFYRNSATNYKQYNVRSNIDAQITNNLKLSVDLSGRIEDRHYPNLSADGIFLDILGTYPGLQPYFPNGLPSAGIQGENPVQEAQGADGQNHLVNNVLQTLVSFEWKLPFITKGLTLSGFAGHDFSFYSGKAFHHPFDLYRYDSTTKSYNNVRGLLGLTTLNENYGSNLLKTYNLKLGYERRFGDHAVNAFFAIEESEYYNEGISAFRKNFISTGIDQIFAGSNAGDDKDNGGSADQNARRNFFGRINYSYKEKYLAEFVMRRDGSFNFPPDKRYGNFPGLSVGWRISEEPFFKKVAPFVNQLKLKASYSASGNDRISQYQFLGTYSLDAGYFIGTGANPPAVPGLTPGVTPNPNVTWEVEKMTNFGLESSLLNSKLDFSIDYFFARRDRILAQRNASIPTSTGLVLPPENIGIVDRHGIEIQLGYKGTVGKDFKYNVSGNFTHTTNKVVFNDESPNVKPWQKVQGYPLNSWFLYKTEGIFHSQAEIDKYPHLSGTKPGDIKYLDYDKDGKITSNDRVRVYESPTPLIVYGIIMNAQYKGFSLNLLWSGQAKAKQVLLPQANNEEFIPPVWVYNNRWTASNPNATLPAAFDRTDNINNRTSDFWLKDASFLKLKTIEVGYTFSPSLMKRLGVSNLRVYANGLNVFSLDKVKYYDPETSTYTGAYYPQTRIFNLGVNLSF